MPDRFFTRLRPTPVAAPRLVRLNTKLALDLGLDPERLATPEGVEMLAGNMVLEGSDPLATAYAGHQFGTFVPQLGDGRAILLGEVMDRAKAKGRVSVRRSLFRLAGSGNIAAAIFLAKKVTTEDELLPPRKLKRKPKAAAKSG